MNANVADRHVNIITITAKKVKEILQRKDGAGKLYTSLHYNEELSTTLQSIHTTYNFPHYKANSTKVSLQKSKKLITFNLKSEFIITIFICSTISTLKANFEFI